MKISQRGLNLIYDFEGRLKKLPDGRYKAYLCPARVWTIYAGCTEGVNEDMIVTEAEGEVMFRREIAKFERCVELACTREPNQNQYDAFVSLAYNIGETGFRRSSVLRFFNAGQDEKAAKAFALWNKGGGRVLKGLVRRRAAEAGLFLRPVDPPPMPQKVDETMSAENKAVIGGAAVVTGGSAILADPVGLSSTLVALKTNTMQLAPAGVSLTTWLVPLLILAAAGLLLLWAHRRAE